MDDSRPLPAWVREHRKPRVVIVGGGFGGLHAARALHRDDVELLVLDRTNHHLFQPLLYQVATATLPPSDITAPIRWLLRKQRNTSTRTTATSPPSAGTARSPISAACACRGWPIVTVVGALHHRRPHRIDIAPPGAKLG